MKTNILSVAIVAASMAIISCDKNDTTVLNSDGAVHFASGITATPGSRAAIDGEGNSVWEAGDPVGIYMVGHATTDVIENTVNVPYTASAAGLSTSFAPAGAAIYYPLEEAAKVNFIAYHPYNVAVADFVYPIDLSTQMPQTNIDLMTARADKSGTGYTKEDGRMNTVVDFVFSHQLVKLVMNVTKDASVPENIVSVKINGMNTTASFDLKGVTGITSPGTPAVITPCTVTAEKRYEAILLPVAVLTHIHTVTFTTDDGKTYKWAMRKEIPSLEAGKIYTYNINVTKYAVTANGSINKWAVGTTGNGTAE